MAINPIPDGYKAVTPYLIVRNASEAIAFYTTVFGAVEQFRLDGPDGRIGHAEIKIGDSPIMLADEAPAMQVVGPETLGGTTVGLMIYVPDVDAVFAKAIENGATVLRPVVDQFYGDRSEQ
jgi:PhnB protein